MEEKAGAARRGAPRGRRRFLFIAIMILLCIVVFVAVGELLVLILRPQVSLYPRWEFSTGYGREHFKNVRMVHRQPRHWKYVYTINEHGYRGRAVPVSDHYDKKNIIVLGDSYSMGMGVHDGEEYAAVMDRLLSDGWNVINTSCGGWGLTQQIRKFYESGMEYKPAVAVLQFCKNDPGDNFIDRVTTFEDGRFVFHDTKRERKPFAYWLSRAYLIQNSQLYMFMRSFYNPFRAVEESAARRAVDSPDDDGAPVGVVHGETKGMPPGAVESEEPPPITRQEAFYNELLAPFADDLHERGVRLLMISVDGELDLYPHIRKTVTELEEQGLLDYIEVTEWFEGVEGYDSPEGHLWGTKGHGIIGERLSLIIKEYESEPLRTAPEE